MALPAVTCALAFRPFLLSPRPQIVSLGAFLTGFCALGLSALITAACLALSGEAFLPVAWLVMFGHLPLMLVEGLVGAAVVRFLQKVKPDALGFVLSAKHAALLCGLCALWTLFALPDAALAHRVYLFAWEEGDRVCSEAYFSKTAKIADAEITVSDADGKVALRGRSDQEGRFCFARPNAGQLLLAVYAGQGHRGEFRLSAQTQTPAAVAENVPGPEPSQSVTDDHEALRRIVREELEQALRPLPAHSPPPLPGRDAEEPGLREILGGLGWIAGLAALLAWYRGRRAS